MTFVALTRAGFTLDALDSFVRGFVHAATWADLQPEACPTCGGSGGIDDDPQDPDLPIRDCPDCDGTGAKDGRDESGSGAYEYGPDDVEPASLEKVRDICARFMAENADDLRAYIVHPKVLAIPLDPGSTAEDCDDWAYQCAGHDLWLTATGSGTGFWDRGLGELGDRLAEAGDIRAGTGKPMTPWAAFEGSGLPWLTSEGKVSFDG